MEEKYLDSLFSSFQETLEKENSPIPSVSLIAAEDNSPYRILASTILSLRTRDKVTYEASMRLFAIAPRLEDLLTLDEDVVAEAIKPSGFYKRKAQQLKAIATILTEKYHGEIPGDMDALLALPGVGIKTASLVLNLSFGMDAICVDCHVHEIANRLGWIRTTTPEETEKALREILPRRFWIPINELFVRWGQTVCLPQAPRCSVCPIEKECPKKGVEKRR